jgi:hypothetical protein
VENVAGGVGSDLELLQEYEPVLRFTAGELFFPTAVEAYVRIASLWELEPGGGAQQVVAAGSLDVDRLCKEAAARPDVELSLRFVAARFDRKQYREWRRRPGRPVFRSGGRFTKVGLLARVIDILFRSSLLLRGRVPGGLAAAAEVAYRTHLAPQHHPYYAHVTREGGYVALQYWFFYAMNDWRSSFGGANDHEADWEQVTVYLAEQPDGTLQPAWVALSAHDEVGDDLRRRWDDPELVREGDHPVVFPGAGSHSGVVVPGDYVTAVDPPGVLHRLLGGLRRLARIFTPWTRGEIAQGIGIPFIDYHRGDGTTIGPGHDRTWSPVVISDDTPWVQQYRGLWGLDTRDRFGGERAPAGPRYERGGVVRQSWSDPLGWAGLQKVPASATETAALLRARVGAIDAEIGGLSAQIDAGRTTLRSATAEATSLGHRQGLAGVAAERRAQLRQQERDLHALSIRRAQLLAERSAHAEALENPPSPPPPQAHLRKKALPVEAETDTRSRFLRIWSTLSTPLLFAAVAFLFFDQNVAVITGLVVFAVVFLGVEAIARRRFLAYAMTIVLAVLAVGLAVLVAQEVFGRWQTVLAAVFGAAAVATLVVNLRDLRRG